MTTELYCNTRGVTQSLTLELWDYCGGGHAVWRGILDTEIRFVEGNVDEPIEDIINRVICAYDEEEE